MSNPNFDDGVLWAVARIVELFDEPRIAWDVLRTSGVDPSRADEADAPYIAIAVAERVDGQDTP